MARLNCAAQPPQQLCAATDTRYKRRFPSFDEQDHRVLCLSARVTGQLCGLEGIEVSADLILDGHEYRPGPINSDTGCESENVIVNAVQG
jgi:hypothetical protein